MVDKMANLKQQALDKMLKEMEQEHSLSEDRIHNWLCEQEDDDLFQGVLKEGYTIKAALKYVSNKARSLPRMAWLVFLMRQSLNGFESISFPTASWRISDRCQLNQFLRKKQAG